MDINPGPPEEVILTVDFFHGPLWVAASVLKQYSDQDYLIPVSRLQEPVELPAEEMPLSEIAERLGLMSA